MTGMERNADIVHMATYAPLFAHVEGWQWRPDMIWFDNLRSVRTASYYVQQLFSHNKGTNVLPLTMNRKAVTGASDQNGLFASAVYDENEKNIIVKIVNTSDKTQSLKLTFNGLKRNERLTSGKLITLSSSDIEAENTLDNPALIIPVENDLSINGNVLDTNIRAYTFKIYKIKKL